jgi:hypothetical protein
MSENEGFKNLMALNDRITEMKIQAIGGYPILFLRVFFNLILWVLKYFIIGLVIAYAWRLLK